MSLGLSSNWTSKWLWTLWYAWSVWVRSLWCLGGAGSRGQLCLGKEKPKSFCWETAVKLLQSNVLVLLHVGFVWGGTALEGFWRSCLLWWHWLWVRISLFIWRWCMQLHLQHCLIQTWFFQKAEIAGGSQLDTSFLPSWEEQSTLS